MAKVTFIRKETDSEIQQTDIVDGQFLVSGEGTSYVDYNEKRVSIGDNANISQLRVALGLNDDTYNKEEIYSKGDLVVYNYTIYECNEDNVSGEWDSSKWTIVPIIEI